MTMFLEQVEIFRSLDMTAMGSSCKDDSFSTPLSEEALQKAYEIADTFIHDNSPNELNLQSNLKKKILDKIERNRSHYNTSSPLDDGTERPEHCRRVSVVPFIDSTLFDDLESYLLLSLKTSQFQPFLDSDVFKQFIENQPLSVLVMLGKQRETSDIIIKVKDQQQEQPFENIMKESESISHMEAYFLRSILESQSSDMWSLVNSTDESQLFSSRPFRIHGKKRRCILQDNYKLLDGESY